MQYMSTRGGPKVNAAAAIIDGIAPDGGLYVPERFPRYPISGIVGKSYLELAAGIFALFLRDFTPAQLAEVAVDAYLNNFPPQIAPCVAVGGMNILELWHGPTSSFKDIALQVLPHLFTASANSVDDDREIVIVVATSGDTGKAALEGFKDVPGVKIIVFYPKNGISTIQELQMTTTIGSNTYVVGVAGDFDDCQKGVKELFSDGDMAVRLSTNNKQISSANSINWARLLPQIVYYYYAYGNMCKQGLLDCGALIDIVVPTGNFGNILAAWYARKMGLPVHKLICASNENDVLTEVIKSGNYDKRRSLHKTTSPSMDILVSSNFERLIFDISGEDSSLTAQLFADLNNKGFFNLSKSLLDDIKAYFVGYKADSTEAASVIKEVYEKYSYILDPHTAVGWSVAQKYQQEYGSEYPLLLVSTVCPYKFPQAVLNALGKDISGLTETELPIYLNSITNVPIPENLASLTLMPIHHDIVCAKDKIKETVIELLGLD